MAKVMTYAVAIDNAINGILDAETIERLEALKGQLAKRNGSGKKGLTKVQKENVGLKADIWDALANAPEGMTATEVGHAVDVSCQRASALLKQMVDENRVVKEKDGKRMVFHVLEDVVIAEGDAE